MTILFQGEELVNPKKTLPLGIIITVIVVSIFYTGISAVLTLIMPYYMLNTDLTIPLVFKYVGLSSYLEIVISIGVVASILTTWVNLIDWILLPFYLIFYFSLYGFLFAVPRIIYSMSTDGLLFPCFSKVITKLKTPALAILSSALFASLLAILFDLNALIDMLSIG